MDPFSIFASIVGVSAAGIKTADTINDIFETIRDGPQELCRVSGEIYFVSLLLDSIAKSLETCTELYQDSLLHTISGIIWRFQDQQNIALEEVKKCRKSRFSHLYRVNRLRRVLTRLNGIKATLSLSLQAMTIAKEARKAKEVRNTLNTKRWISAAEHQVEKNRQAIVQLRNEAELSDEDLPSPNGKNALVKHFGDSTDLANWMQLTVFPKPALPTSQSNDSQLTLVNDLPLRRLTPVHDTERRAVLFQKEDIEPAALDYLHVPFRSEEESNTIEIQEDSLIPLEKIVDTSASIRFNKRQHLQKLDQNNSNVLSNLLVSWTALEQEQVAGILEEAKTAVDELDKEKSKQVAFDTSEEDSDDNSKLVKRGRRDVTKKVDAETVKNGTVESSLRAPPNTSRSYSQASGATHESMFLDDVPLTKSPLPEMYSELNGSVDHLSQLGNTGRTPGRRTLTQREEMLLDEQEMRVQDRMRYREKQRELRAQLEEEAQQEQRARQAQRALRAQLEKQAQQEERERKPEWQRGRQWERQRERQRERPRQQARDDWRKTYSVPNFSARNSWDAPKTPVTTYESEEDWEYQPREHSPPRASPSWQHSSEPWTPSRHQVYSDRGRQSQAYERAYSDGFRHRQAELDQTPRESDFKPMNPRLRAEFDSLHLKLDRIFHRLGKLRSNLPKRGSYPRVDSQLDSDLHKGIEELEERLNYFDREKYYDATE